MNSETGNAGSMFREARKERGLTLEWVQQRTRIPVKWLRAMEENRFNELPGNAYVYGFVKNYCELLEIDFKTLWKIIKTQGDFEPGPESQPSNHVSDSLTFSQTGIFPAITLLAILLAAGTLWYARSEKAGPKRDPLFQPVTTIKPLRPPQNLALTISFRRRAWVRIYCDGKNKFEGWVPESATQHWNAKESFKIRTPSPKDIRLVFNGTKRELSGIPHDGSGNYTLTR